MTDTVFLNALRTKLKGGNAKSIHLNVLPARYVGRLDLANLNYINPKLAESFLEQLLNKSSFDFKISFDGIDLGSITNETQKQLGLLSKRLNAINYENEDNFNEHGIKTFGFGFPILVFPSSDPTKIIKAPLFIWQLEIIKESNKVNTWKISRNKSKNGSFVELHSITLNEVLLSFLKSDKDNLVIPQVDDELLEDSVISKTELIDECNRILQVINGNSERNYKDVLIENLNNPINNIPDKERIESVSGNTPSIYFGGVFGLYKTQKESIINDLDKIIDKIDNFKFENLKFENFNGTAHSAINTDPSQQEILSTLGTERKRVIQGPPGTGKSQSLTALITNALANNLKCLVVCEKKTALDVIRKNLQIPENGNNQLASLIALIEDTVKDRKTIVSSVRKRLSNLSVDRAFNQTTYATLLETVESKAAKINHQHLQLQKVIYHDKSWTQLIGDFLKMQRSSELELLKTKLDNKRFKFVDDNKELAQIINMIKTAKELYAEIKCLNHPLNILGNSYFKNNDWRNTKLEIEQFTKKSSINLDVVNTELQNQLSEYISWIDNHYLHYYNSLKTEIKNFKEFVCINQLQFGELFFKNDKTTNFRIRAFSVLSNKYRTLKNNRQLLIDNALKIKLTHSTLNYFSHSYVDEKQLKSLKVIVSNIDKLNNSTDKWFIENEKIKQDFKLSFSSNKLHPLFKNTERLKNTETEFEKIISLFKQLNFLERNLTSSITHTQKISEVKLLQSEIEIVTENLTNFRVYFEWRKFFIEISVLERDIIKSLIESECLNWIDTFSCWYYYWLIAKAEMNLISLPRNDNDINELIDLNKQFKPKQIQQILNNWHFRQRLSVEKFNSKIIDVNILYNLGRNAVYGKNNSLKKIIGFDFGLFSDFFPVVMVSPSVCSSIIPLKEGLFDIVIFDEASQLRIEDTFPALLRGKIKVVSGDSRQMPPSNFFQGGGILIQPTDGDGDDDGDGDGDGDGNIDFPIAIRKLDNSIALANSESLLDYAIDSGYKQSTLKVHYRSKHPHLIDFSNHAFYGKELIPMPAKQEYKSIQFIEVNGVYEDQTNKAEARQVVDILLNHIKPFRNGEYPSVGVATFNLYQRNLILEEIAKNRQTNQEFDKKISALGSTLFVKNLENIQGDERDIIILSTTFGKKPSGSFGQSFGPISNHTKGYKLLNVIITRAKYKVYICTSIPNEAIQMYPQLIATQFSGNGVFYAYLAYSKAISDGNFPVANQILDEIHELSPFKISGTGGIDIGSESPFEHEVFYRLAERIGIERIIQQHWVGGFRIDMVVKSKITGNPLIAIECDGATYHSSNEAYAWDIFRQTHLENQGFKFHRIWSTNWWNSANKELEKLVEFIFEIDRLEIQEEKITNEVFDKEEIIPITLRPEIKKIVEFDSEVTVKNPDGSIIKVKFCKTQAGQNLKPNKKGIITVPIDSFLALAIFGKTEGETCQQGMLEYYYEILKVE